MSKFLLAIDAGTGSVRAALFDLHGRQIACASQEWTHSEDPRYPGSMDFAWEKNWEYACRCIREAIREAQIEPEDILALSTTCMREGIVLYNQEGKEIWACANVDARANDEVEWLLKNYPGLEKELYQISGQSFALDALPRLLWVKEKQPEIYKQIAHIGMFNDWLIYRLTGKLIAEPSNGSTSGLMSLTARTWQKEILERIGLRSDIFPAVQESGTYVANIRESASKETGLSTQTKVIVGGGDAQLGCIGVGVVNKDEAAVFGGSFWQYECNISEALLDKNCRVRVNCHALPNMWQYEALAFKPGLVMRWYRDAFCQYEKEIAKQNGRDVYDVMNEKASAIPAGCYGMMCTFSDVMNFTHWKHASPSFVNFDINPEKFNRYTFYRCLLENTALLTKAHYDLVKEVTGCQPDSIVFAGGAAKSGLWSQILADVLGIPVHVPAVKEATSLGAAILAGYGAGIYPSVEKTAKDLVRIEKTYYPDKENHQTYLAMMPVFEKIYAAQLALADQNITRSFWSAPGL